MVKADLTRDYYADLELQAGATEAEIKKQFKKLALKYHPDRNPGREAEVNAKFQTINSAHEVLTDPEQRAKYDSTRARNNTSRSYAGYGSTTTTASGTKGNPWSSAGSQWAPPPKPPPPRKQPPPASAGAQRYANFATYATPNGTPPRANQDAEARRKNWEAWENMKPPTRPWQPPKPVPKEFTPQSGREESNNAKHAPPPKSSKPGYEEFRTGTASRAERTSPSRTSSNNAPPRRNGFMPATPGGDEPPASNTSAYTTFRTGRTPSEKKSGPPQPPPRAAPPPDPLRQFREQAGTPYEPRLSTPYATHGGEKTNPFESINLNRSKSTRAPSGRTNQPRAEFSKGGGSYERYRSASPPRARSHRRLSPEPGIARADSEINLGTSPKRTFSHANPSFPPNEPSKAHQKPIVEDNTSSNGDDSDSDTRQQYFGSRSKTFAKRRNPQTAGRAQEAPSPSGKPNNGTGMFNEEHLRKPSLAHFREWWWATHEAKRNVLNDLTPDGPQSGRSTASNGPNSGKTDEPSIFSFNVDSKTFESSRPTETAFTNSGTEKISTTFSPDDWHGKFEAGDYFATKKTGTKGASRARSGDRARSKSPVKGRPMTRSQTNLGSSTAFPSDIDPEVLQQTTDGETPMSPGGTKFTAEEWARTFNPQVFAPPPYPSSTSTRPPSKPRRARTGSSTPRVPKVHKTAGTAAMAGESSSEDSLLEMASRRTQTNAPPSATQNPTATSTDSPNAMDIDSPSDQQSEPVKFSRENGDSSKENSNEARNVPLEPSRPEWRSANTNGADVKASPTGPLKPDLPQRPVGGRTFRRRTTKSWDEEDFKTTFEDLKNVEPLHHPATGLHSFADLTSNLPFPSQAASRLTIPRDFGSGQLALPHPPRAPMVPRIAEGAIRPTPSSWESYLLAFRAYMADWDIFNTKIIMHFVARRNQLDGMKSGWLEAFGNSDLDKYREGLKEDRKVREWWAVACEKHEAGMDQFQWFKNCMKDGVAATSAAAGK